MLLQATPTPIMHGGIAGVDREMLATRAASLENIDAELARKIVSLIADQPDDVVNAIRPFWLARVWNVDPRETLRAFLHAARVGLVDLQWQLNCPVCQVGAGSASSRRSINHACDRLRLGLNPSRP